MNRGFIKVDMDCVNPEKLPQSLAKAISDLKKQDTQSMYQYHTDEPKHDHSRDTGNK